MLIVLAVFAILIFHDFQKFIRKKVPARVFVLYVFFMAVSLTISLLLTAGRRPSPPSQWIEAIFKMIGVLE